MGSISFDDMHWQVICQILYICMSSVAETGHGTMM